MRNLQLIEADSSDSCHQFESTQNVSIDYDTGNVYAVNSYGVAVYDPRSRQFIQVVSLTEAGFLPPDGSGVVVGLQHLPDQMSACIATASGDVILWNTTTNELECVGTVDSGLTAMAWSPDQELLVLATGQSSLIAMTREFDPITEVPMLPQEFGEAEFITVGWGKKETQFHGSEGKEAAKRKHDAVKPAFPWDDHGVRISWRGDGQYFVVSTISPLNGAREVRVWTRDMVLHSTSEKVDGLEQALSWKPSGSLIASSQRRPNKHDIVFLEKNGLRHGEFTLPFGVDEVKVRDVFWNNDSTVLLVWCEDKLEEGDGTTVPKTYVQLWTMNNYHWYLKQSINFSADTAERVTTLVWDPEHAYRLHIVCSGGKYLQYTFSWTTSHSLGQTADDLANVSVIDGVKVLMTPFRNMVVPPPMCAYHLEMPAPASMVAFGPPSQANAFAVLLNDRRIAIYRFTNGDNSITDNSLKPSAGKNFLQMCATPRLAGIYSLPSMPGDNVPLGLYHLTWYRDDKLLVSSRCNGESIISWIELKNDKCSVTSNSPFPGSVLAIATDQETGTLVVQLTDRTLLVYDKDCDIFAPLCDSDGREIMFPQACTQMSVCNFGGEEVVLGLTERFRFYVNDIEVANNCTSFALHDEFLILTTHSHTCHCIKRNTPLKSLSSLSEGKAHPFDETIRRVERGSRIVHVVPEDTKLILQMPRGNIETIHPRALVLSAVRKRLNKLEFGEAFILMKKHRINMNLIFDHNPEIFLNNVETFVRQVESVDHINLFLTNTQEEDVTKTMYTAAYDNTEDSNTLSDTGKESKIDVICEAMREAVEKIDSDKYLLSILTAYVKKTSPELDTALNRIKSLKEASNNRSQHVSEEALKYLLFLVDVNELYDHALGTYDFDLVLMVAEKSQKDPKEYLPFLNELRTLEENYQRYTIDLHLKRHKKALTHIVKCGNEHFAECLSLVKEQKLYAEALRLFPRDGKHYKDIAVAYGLYLTEKNQSEEAGLVYYKAGEWELAHSSFTQARNWRQALITAHKLGYTPEKMAEFATSMAAKLVEDRKHVEAACLLEQYAGDVEEAIMTLINGSCWDESLRLMYKHNRTDFIESDLIAALVESFNNHMSNIDTLRSDFERYRTRLAIVRQEKERVRLEILEGGGDHNLADADLFSDTSSATGESVVSSRYSGASGRTSSSRRSGRSRRKAERKLWSLKEGSRHEDLALVEALYQLCQRANALREDIQPLLKMLFLFFYEEKASDLQAKLDEFLALITRHTPAIWNPENEANSSNTQPTLGPDATTNSIIAAMQQGRSQKPEVQLEPHLRIPPPMGKDNKWQLQSLSADNR